MLRYYLPRVYYTFCYKSAEMSFNSSGLHITLCCYLFNAHALPEKHEGNLLCIAGPCSPGSVFFTLALGSLKMNARLKVVCFRMILYNSQEGCTIFTHLMVTKPGNTPQVLVGLW